MKFTYLGTTSYVSVVFTASGSIVTTTFKAAVASILENDAQQSDSGTLGELMEYDATSRPDLVFFVESPQDVVPPKLTYGVASKNVMVDVNKLPQRIVLSFTAWGNNFEAILARVYTLLQNSHSLTADNYYCRSFIYDNSSTELWDDDLKVYYRTDRYTAILLPK